MKTLFCVFCIVLGWGSFGMNSDVKEVLTYLNNNANVCFHEKYIERKDMLRKLNSPKINDTILCIKICGTMIGHSLFEQTGNFSKLKNVVSLLSDDSDKNYTGERLQFTESVFSRLSNDTNINYLHKLAFFAPTATQKLSLSDWLLNFDPFVKNGNNYELAKWNKEYDLELALCMLFTPVFIPFWEGNNYRKQYVKDMCGAIRTYLYYAENKTIDTLQNQTQPSSFIILKDCYDFYSKKVNTKGVVDFD